MTPWERFATVARGGTADKIPVAFIVDSPWLPGFFGIDTLDYFLRPDEWLRVNLALRERFPEIAWIPGFWVEYGMAVEPSVFGARIMWHHDQPPAIEHVPGGLATLLQFEPADPQQHGLMPFVLQRYVDAEKCLLPEGLPIKMVAARGPLAVAGWLLGITELLVGLKIDPESHARLLDTLTTTIIAWLRAQLAVLRAPESILVLDDIVGMLSPKLFDQFALPYYSRIFSAFEGKIRVFHNDTPCAHLLDKLPTLGFDVFNFSQEMDIATVQAKMPRVALMGNVPTLDVMVRGTPAQAETWARECIRKTNGRGLILSAGGGVSPGTPAETIEAVVKAVGSRQ
jgi:uroporphyrinogen decarboxylase